VHHDATDKSSAKGVNVFWAAEVVRVNVRNDYANQDYLQKENQHS
jgi:hypothetical protein